MGESMTDKNKWDESAPVCGNCKYYYGRDGSECRRYPPMASTEVVGRFFPNVRLTDWCGEFVAAVIEKYIPD